MEVSNSLVINQSASNTGLQDDSGPENSNQKKSATRKRTKTGCLTCRKRRIKCDEGKPVCNNCIKSKRICDGYSQRVVFKENPRSGHDIPFDSIQNSALDPSDGEAAIRIHHRSTPRVVLPTIAPRPATWTHEQSITHGHTPVNYGGSKMLQGQLQGGIALDSTYDLNGQSQYDLVPNPLLSGGTTSHYSSDMQQGSTLLMTNTYAGNNGEGQSNLLYSQASGHELLQREPGNHMMNVDMSDDDIMEDSDDEVADSENPQELVITSITPSWGGYGAVGTSSTFAHCRDLFSYMEHPNQSELRESGSREMFAYFISVTSPTISMYERHPFSSAESMQSGSRASFGNDLWCHTIPLISVQHPGLHRAILALASLQFANLQNIPATTAARHYHHAIRRIARNIKMPSRRTTIATLAATLLLAYFEVWHSEHMKWCSHLLGARILFKEIDLRKHAKISLPAKQRREAEERLKAGKPASNEEGQLNYSLLQIITGYPVCADDYGLQIGQPQAHSHIPASDRDVKLFENYADLFWWYCKMDVYQSILGGTKLFMEYPEWKQCPPRSPISNTKHIYGTYDHVVLLLGRVADFAAKDLRRKRRLWKEKQGTKSNDSPPPFPGIIPTRGNFEAPMGFSPPHDASPQSEQISEDSETPGLPEAAIQEWEAIREAFETMKGYFGPGFQPLSSEYADRRDSPFGAVVQYRSYAVAGVWMNYYMGLIHLYRAHPRMPPAAMQAAAIAEQDTSTFANQIGRIAAGLSEDTAKLLDVNPLSAAAFIESSFCLFVAGVQFQDPEQRDWLIQRMHDVSRLTGWRSANQIATGCESAWIKGAQMGRGPYYERRVDLEASLPPMWRRLDRRIREVEEQSDGDRRIVLAREDRAYYAVGLLGVEEDMKVLILNDDN